MRMIKFLYYCCALSSFVLSYLFIYEREREREREREGHKHNIFRATKYNFFLKNILSKKKKKCTNLCYNIYKQ